MLGMGLHELFKRLEWMLSIRVKGRVSVDITWMVEGWNEARPVHTQTGRLPGRMALPGLSLLIWNFSLLLILSLTDG